MVYFEHFLFFWCLFKFYSSFHSTLSWGAGAEGVGVGISRDHGAVGTRAPPTPCWCGAVLFQDPLRPRSPDGVSPAASPLRRERAGEALHPRHGEETPASLRGDPRPRVASPGRPSPHGPQPRLLQLPVCPAGGGVGTRIPRLRPGGSSFPASAAFPTSCKQPDQVTADEAAL